MKKGKEKRRKITLKKGKEALKNASPWAIISKKFREGVFRPPLRPPCRRAGLPPAHRKLICRGKKNESKKRGGEFLKCTIYTPGGNLNIPST